jgi:hypothetical protein
MSSVKAKKKKQVVVKPIHLFHVDSIIPPDLVWNLIIRPHCSINDLSRLDCAIAVKSIRKAYCSTFEKDDQADIYNEPILPLFYNVSWREDDVLGISDMEIACWLHSHLIQFHGLSIDESYLFEDEYGDEDEDESSERHLFNELAYSGQTLKTLLIEHLASDVDDEADIVEDASMAKGNVIASMLASCPQLQELDTGLGDSKILHEGLIKQSDKLRNLRKLTSTVRYDPSFDSWYLLIFLQHFPQLTHLRVTYEDLTHPLEIFTEIYPNILEIYLSHPPDQTINDETLRHYSRSFPNLESLQLLGGAYVALEDIAEAPIFPKLRSLRFDYMVIEEVHMESFSKCFSNVKALLGASCELDAMEIFLSECSHLEELVLDDWGESRLTAEDYQGLVIAAVAFNKNLKSLTLQRLQLPSFEDEELNESCKVEKLIINNCTVDRFMGIFGWTTFSSALKKVTISCSRMSIEDLEDIAGGMKKGSVMTLYGVDGVSKSELKKLRKDYPHVRFLDEMIG